MIKLQDARIADGLPRVVAEQPWAKVLSAVYGELQGRMLEYLATGMTFSDVDNCSEGMLDQMAIYLKIEWYDSAADIETKRKLVRTAIEIQRYAGTVKAVREQVETIYKKARIEESIEKSTRTNSRVTDGGRGNAAASTRSSTKPCPSLYRRTRGPRRSCRGPERKQGGNNGKRKTGHESRWQHCQNQSQRRVQRFYCCAAGQPEHQHL